MWNSMVNKNLGLMNKLDEMIFRLFQSDSSSMPNLHFGETLLILSDYSGQHKSSYFEGYSFLITVLEGWRQWEEARLDIRKDSKLGSRTFAFKKLGDNIKMRNLPRFLSAANLLPGYCATIIIDKTIESMFRKVGRIDLKDPGLAEYSSYSRQTFERLLRIVQFCSFFVAGFSKPNQNVMWFTDQDEIAASDKGVIKLTDIWGKILGHYLNHNLCHIKCGTTKCDDGTLQIEDIASIPDLTAGTLVEVMNCFKAKGLTPVDLLELPLPESVSMKSRVILNWILHSSPRLKHIVFLIEPRKDSAGLSLKCLKLSDLSMLI